MKRPRYEEASLECALHDAAYYAQSQAVRGCASTIAEPHAECYVTRMACTDPSYERTEIVMACAFAASYISRLAADTTAPPDLKESAAALLAGKPGFVYSTKMSSSYKEKLLLCTCITLAQKMFGHYHISLKNLMRSVDEDASVCSPLATESEVAAALEWRLALRVLTQVGGP